MSAAGRTTTSVDAVRDAYLALVQDALLGKFGPARELVPLAGPRTKKLLGKLADTRWTLARWHQESLRDIEEGRAWPRHATTMIGRPRLDNLRDCIEDVLANEVPGDVIETGVWRGGASIYMRAILKAWNVTDRKVWVADSFQGLPPPDLEGYPVDATAFPFHEHNEVLGVSLQEVQANFAKFGLLDDQVTFLKGWFKDTLPSLVDHRWAVARLDGDLYESTIQALTSLYPSLSPGGWLIVDDYNLIPECQQAATDYRQENDIVEPIQEIDHNAACWQRGHP